MQTHLIDDLPSWEAMKDYVKQNNYSSFKNISEGEILELSFEDHESFRIPIANSNEALKSDVNNFLNSLNYNPLIFGKDKTPNIVSCEVVGDVVEIFTEKNGVVSSSFIPNTRWLLSCRALGPGWKPLKGKLYYSWIKTYEDEQEWNADRRRYKDYVYSIYDSKEAAMLYNGFTYFKDLKVNDVSILSFDIESVGLEHNEDSKVLLISNTFRKNGQITRKLFAYNDYDSESEFFIAWCNWVAEVNPSIICGHNILGYDLPYLHHCAEKAGAKLLLGRDDSEIRFNEYESKYRKDQTQFLLYKNAYIYGREIVDTMFLSIKYDVASKKYENFRLKNIIAQEGLEVEGRQHYDASTIAKNYLIPEEWVKIKQYALHDADDALALFDLMVPAFFYLNRSIPKSFQTIINSASGSQINSFLVRAYLQEGHSIPKASDAHHFEGATSFGNPGIYKSVFKIDVASLYPSIMLQYQIFDTFKDPNQNFLKMVNYFTNERLENKKKGKETGDKYYKDMEQAQKIVINSAYGMMGAPGLNFNSPLNAAKVTRIGREILQTAIEWAKENGFIIVNADTDSISFCYEDRTPLSEEDRTTILTLVNALYPEKIRFEDDGYYKGVLVLKAKNYALDDGVKIKLKGSSIKSSNKEKGLKEFMEKVIKCLLNDRKEDINSIYHEYVKEVFDLKDITRWSSKRTLTEKVLNPERTNEQKVFDAIENSEYTAGDKIYVYFTQNGSLKLQEQWDNDHDPIKLVEKIYKTLEIFDEVIDVKQYNNYKLKKNEGLLRELLGLPPILKEKKTRKKKDG